MPSSTLLIRTPEGVVFSQPLAGPVVRFLAWGLDLACILGVVTVLSYAVALLAVISADLARAGTILTFFVVSIAYGMVLEWFWRGQTVGKRVLGLRVMDAQGLRLTIQQVVLRNLLRFVDMLPMLYLVGGLAMVLNRRNQRLGDFAANTVVVRLPVLLEPDLSQVLAGKFNSLRTVPHLEARLRQRTTPAEAALALQAVTRRDRLEAAARVELFAELAAHFRTKVKFPAEVVEGLPDEQFVRNVVDALYRPRAGAAREPAAEPSA
jgi:uncharacterized RDD family membrane protein YckC